MPARRVSDRTPESRALDGLFSACKFNGRNGADAMREAVRVQTAGLGPDQLRHVIVGLSGFISAAYEYLEDEER